MPVPAFAFRHREGLEHTPVCICPCYICVCVSIHAYSGFKASVQCRSRGLAKHVCDDSIAFLASRKVLLLIDVSIEHDVISRSEIEHLAFGEYLSVAVPPCVRWVLPKPLTSVG